MMKFEELKKGMIFQHVKGEKTYKVIGTEEAGKTVLLEDGLGNTKNTSYSTLRRWYVYLNIMEVEEEKEEAPTKKERKPRSKKENPIRDNFIAGFDKRIAEAGYIKIMYDKMPNFIVLRREEKGRVKFEFYTGISGIKINMKQEVAEALELDYKLRIGKYYLPAIVSVNYADEDFNDIVNAVLESDF